MLADGISTEYFGFMFSLQLVHMPLVGMKIHLEQRNYLNDEAIRYAYKYLTEH